MDHNRIIEVQNLKQYYQINDRLTVKAIDNISFEIKQGEVFGLVGETGCGKSTAARILSGICQPTDGTVLYDGAPIYSPHISQTQRKRRQQEIQMIFQDSAASLNPRMTVKQIILEPLHIQKKKFSPHAAARISASSNTTPEPELLAAILDRVGMPPDFLPKYPGELSGGQRQRIAIARSLVLSPRLIIADEPISSLDVSIQAQILTLFQKLQKENGFSFLFISHDLSVVRFISDRIGIMLQGKLVEIAPKELLFQNPLHPYTKALLSAIHVPDPVYERNKKILYYDHSQPAGSRMTEAEPEHFVLK